VLATITKVNAIKIELIFLNIFCPYLLIKIKKNIIIGLILQTTLLNLLFQVVFKN